MAITADGRRAAVSHPDIGRISLVALDSFLPAGQVDIGGQPFGLAFLPDDSLLVTDWSGNRLSRVAPDGGQRHLAVGRAPSAVLVDAARGLAYTIDRESDRLTRIDLDAFAVTGVVALGQAPFAGALSPDGRRAFVANVRSGDLSVIDLERMTETARLPLTGMPYGVAVDAAARLVLVTDQEAGTLVAFDLDDLHHRWTARVGDYSEGVGIIAPGRTAIVANWGSDSVSLVDLLTARSRAFDLPEGPRMIATHPALEGATR